MIGFLAAVAMCVACLIAGHLLSVVWDRRRIRPPASSCTYDSIQINAPLPDLFFDRRHDPDVCGLRYGGACTCDFPTDDLEEEFKKLEEEVLKRDDPALYARLHPQNVITDLHWDRIRYWTFTADRW